MNRWWGRRTDRKCGFCTPLGRGVQKPHRIFYLRWSLELSVVCGAVDGACISYGVEYVPVSHIVVADDPDGFDPAFTGGEPTVVEVKVEASNSGFSGEP